MQQLQQLQGIILALFLKVATFADSMRGVVDFVQSTGFEVFLRVNFELASFKTSSFIGLYCICYSTG